MPTPKIPDEIYENRCKYCRHFCQEGENRVFQDNEVYSYSVKKSCGIIGIAGYSYQVWDGECRVVDEIVYDDGECRTFSPWYSYPGICASCAYHNPFVKGCCTNNNRGSDFRPVFIGQQYGEKNPYEYHTCSKWKINVSTIENTPTADVVEVRHGEWIKQKPNPETMQIFHDMGLGKGMSVNSIYWTCSVCKNWGTPTHKYCCSCGAKMDGERKEENEG